MTLSKHERNSSLTSFIYEIVGRYFSQLYTHPIRTKSITSCIVATLGNLTSQCLYGNKSLDRDNLVAFAAFGLLFGGTIPHTFYHILDKTMHGDKLSMAIRRFLVERLFYAPLFQVFSLYTLAVFEGRSHQEACRQLSRTFSSVLRANWYWLSLPMFVNVNFVPPMFRVLFGNLLGFFWIIFLARKRKALTDRRGNRE